MEDVTRNDHLDPRPRRADLTNRECASLLGAFISGLISNSASVAAVYDAVKWWAGPIAKPAWEGMTLQEQAGRVEMGLSLLTDGPGKEAIEEQARSLMKVLTESTLAGCPDPRRPS
jgi:hypothetical protein